MASQMLEQIIALENHGIQIKAILGIENSPTCAVSWIFTHRVGAERRKGLFIGDLARQLNLEGKAIPFVGITRYKKNQKKEIEQLMEAIQS